MPATRNSLHKKRHTDFKKLYKQEKDKEGNCTMIKGQISNRIQRSAHMNPTLSQTST